MSFNIELLTPLNNGKNGKVPTMWTYWNKDGDTLTETGYFTKSSGLRNGDQIVVIGADYTTRTNGYVLESNGILTFIAQ